MAVKTATVGILCILLSGCIRPQQFETPPVDVQMSSGVVTCQLYTRELTEWDRSIDRPPEMSIEHADQICRAEGRRQLHDT